MDSPQLSRRELLRAGALAAGAASLGLPFAAGDARANAYLRRCVTLGANGVINPGSAQDYRNNRPFLLETKTKWVRLWADWPSLQPESTAPDAGSAAWKVLELDKQIRQANADGISVILTSYRFPRWANGTASLTPEQDLAYQLHDRIPKGGDPAKRRDLRFKVPSDLSTTGAWGRWIRFLVARYSRRSSSRKGIVSFLEVCNEPNLQFWPQQGPGGTSDPYAPGPPIAHIAAARMFQTAKTIVAGYGGEPLLCGPALSDRLGDSRLGAGYDTFATRLLNELALRKFTPGTRFAWSHHNFTDVELGSGSRAANLHTLLKGKWPGWPSGDAAAPTLLIDEGGARLTRIASLYGSSDPAFVRAKQAELLQRNWQLMTGTQGAGVAMMAQYLFRTDPNYDSGLCDADGTRRPAYSAWGALPSYA